MNLQVLLSFLAYLGILLLIGALSYKKQKSSADFIVGNRSLNFWLTALTAHASDMSSWLFMAFPAAIMIGGLSQAWIGIGLCIGMFCNWQFVAKKLRKSTEKYDSYTLSSYFESRFKDNTGILRLATGVMSIFFLTAYVSAGLIAMGNFFESVFGLNYTFGITIATLTFVLYTFFGGFVTVAWTDLFQGIFLLAVIIFVPIVAFFKLENGWASIHHFAELNQVRLSLIPDPSLQSILTIFFIIASWGLGYFGQPHIVTKFMGIKSPDELNKSKYLGMAWMSIGLTAAAAVGLVGIAFFANPLSNPELVFVEMVKTLFSPLFAGFILCAVLAASISTMASQILVCGSVLSEDFYKHLSNKNATSNELLNVSRIGVVGVAIVSLVFALNRSTTILDAVLYAWVGLGASFGPLVLASLYSRKVNRYGAIAGILVGGLLAASWDKLNPYLLDFTIPAMMPAFSLGLLSIYVVSWITQPCIQQRKVSCT